MPRRELVVMKFGGTSVADPEKIQRAAERAVAARRRGVDVVVVVSAPGDMTDELLELSRRVNARPDARELDVLLATGEQVSIALFALACRKRGARAISLTGAQAGVLTDGRHGAAKITAIDFRRIRLELRRGGIAVIAGFQGIDARADVTTLGRGGSDLSAVAIAGALKARFCEIYTDVDGVYTADPRLVSHARRIGRLSYEEMSGLAAAGAQVMQPRSITAARRLRVRIHVRSSFHANAGTWIVPAAETNARPGRVRSLALGRNGARARIVGVGRQLPRGRAAQEAAAALAEAGLTAKSIKLRSGLLHVEVPAREADAALRVLHKSLRLADAAGGSTAVKSRDRL